MVPTYKVREWYLGGDITVILTVDPDTLVQITTDYARYHADISGYSRC